LTTDLPWFIFSRMSDQYRTRSEGWVKAKKEGHLNEDSLTTRTITPEIQNILREGEEVISIEGGGIKELSVVTIFGYKAPSKTDKKIVTNQRTINISLKKSNAGQVYLLPSYKFFSGFEIWYDKEVPAEVGEIITLFTGESPDIKDVLQIESVRIQNQQVSKSQRTRRLCFDALMEYDKEKVDTTIQWFKDNIGLITDFVFKRGLSDSKDEFADYIYYKNFLDKTSPMNHILKIDDFTQLCQDNSHTIELGSRYGKTSIQLPFGHLQMHKGMLQFHHNFNKIVSLLGNG